MSRDREDILSFVHGGEHVDALDTILMTLVKSREARDAETAAKQAAIDAEAAKRAAEVAQAERHSMLSALAAIYREKVARYPNQIDKAQWLS